MKRTTVIVGAGASSDFGLPLGSTLVEKIFDLLDENFGPSRGSGNGVLANALRSRIGQGMSPQDVSAALALRDGLIGTGTIDQLIGARAHMPGVEEIGKLAISAAILQAEAESPLAFDGQNREEAVRALRGCRHSWIAAYLRQVVGPVAADKFRSALAQTDFVVFNYDRCLERYLYFHLRYVIGLGALEADQALERISITHVFGSLGDGIHKDLCDAPYGDTSNLGRCASRIQTFTEKGSDSLTRQLREVVEDAEQYVFLGFGFNPSNIRRLFGSRPVTAPVYATVKGMRPAQVEEIGHRFDDFHPTDGTSAELIERLGPLLG